MANITVTYKTYTLYAAISTIDENGEFDVKKVKCEISKRDSRGAQKAIAAQYGVKAKDVNVIKIDTVKNSIQYDGEIEDFKKCVAEGGFKQITE